LGKTVIVHEAKRNNEKLLIILSDYHLNSGGNFQYYIIKYQITMKIKKLLTLTIFILFALIILSSCAEVQHIEACQTGHTFGFFGGLLHGIIAPVSFVISLFSDHVAVWAVNNNGGWYTFGFLIGVGGLGFGGSKASR